MKKLKLQVEHLAVESFATAEGTGARGTVRAHGTMMGQTCGPERTCGPQTCGQWVCVFETDGCDTMDASCPGPCQPGTNTCPTAGELSCVGCTTYDYTVNAGHDSCGFCMSFESDSPQRCRCI